MTLSIPEIVKARKQLSVKPEWDESNYYSEFLIPLEIEEVTFQGLEFRGKAYGSNPNEQVMFQIEYNKVGMKIGALSRFDWRPRNQHINRMKGPKELHGRKFNFFESHFHDFELNWLEHEKRMRSGNLPIARPVEKDPESFEELTLIVEELFNIEGVRDIPRPLWQPKLL